MVKLDRDPDKRRAVRGFFILIFIMNSVGYFMLTDEAYEEAKALLATHFESLLALSKALIQHEVMDRDEMIAVTGITPCAPRYQCLNNVTAMHKNPVPRVK